MKRVHLFEFEDFNWFSNSLREAMTNYIVAMHKMLGTAPQLAKLIDRALNRTSSNQLVDLCSGGSGPMTDVISILKTDYQQNDLQITLTDLYPNKKAAKRINGLQREDLKYSLQPVDASKVGKDLNGVRTMVCSMHHMTPDTALAILKDAQDAKQPLVVYEISNNTMPALLVILLAFPINFLTVFFVTPFVRPFTWQQFVFTYIIPLLPLFIGWDGAVSYVRAYSMKDWEELTNKIRSEDYIWEAGVLAGKGGKKSYLLGLPKQTDHAPTS